eukprot:7376715-Prymnesium_polylepis.2
MCLTLYTLDPPKPLAKPCPRPTAAYARPPRSANLAAFLTKEGEPTYWANIEQATAANAHVCVDKVLIRDIQLRYPRTSFVAFDADTAIDANGQNVTARYSTTGCDALAYRWGGPPALNDVRAPEPTHTAPGQLPAFPKR